MASRFCPFMRKVTKAADLDLLNCFECNQIISRIGNQIAYNNDVVLPVYTKEEEFCAHIRNISNFCQ